MLKNIENIDESFTFCFLDYQISGLKLDINAQKALDWLHAWKQLSKKGNSYLYFGQKLSYEDK